MQLFLCVPHYLSYFTDWNSVKMFLPFLTQKILHANKEKAYFKFLIK